ncbi:MAG TPA: peptidoglycan-binding domain-containing protein [Chthoniobacter sp.]|jgi:hypothetical protein
MMQRIFSLGLAAVAATWLMPAVYAGGWGGGSGSFSGGTSAAVSGGHGSSGGHSSGGFSGSHAGAGATHFSSPSGGGGHFSHSANFASHSGARTNVVPSALHASTAAAPVAGHASTGAAPVVNVNRAFAPARTGNPTLAFGGSTGAIRGGGRAFSPPGDVTRNWDRNHFHNWNHHRYRCFNGGWIYVDDGFPYDDMATADNDQQDAPYPPYPPNVNGVMNNGQAPANGGANDDPPSANQQSPASDGADYGTPDTLIVNVQDALTHRGYATGVSNGTFGPMTETALSNFQRDHELPITGRIDGRTLKALGLL